MSTPGERDDHGTLWGVGLGPGDPELVTVKAARVIAEADVVWIVYPLDTGLGTSTIRAVQSTLTAHQLLLDRRATRLRFVCTKNEHVADDTARRLGLIPETGDAERRAARDAATRQELARPMKRLIVVSTSISGKSMALGMA